MFNETIFRSVRPRARLLALAGILCGALTAVSAAVAGSLAPAETRAPSASNLDGWVWRARNSAQKHRIQVTNNSDETRPICLKVWRAPGITADMESVTRGEPTVDGGACQSVGARQPAVFNVAYTMADGPWDGANLMVYAAAYDRDVAGLEDTTSFKVAVATEVSPPAAVRLREGGRYQHTFWVGNRDPHGTTITYNVTARIPAEIGTVHAAPATVTVAPGATQAVENRIPPGGDLPNTGQPLASAAARGPGFQGEVAIVPDPRTNSLLVRATPGDYELVRSAVEQIDIRPLQVIIEVAIAEVRRNSAFGYALSARIGKQLLRRGANTSIEGSTAPESPREDLSVGIGGIGGVDLNLELRAGESQGAVTILSRPVLLAANNEQAEMLVGDQRPFVQLQESTDGGNLRQVVQYKDVGTKLAVLPTISGDGYVQLQVTQEVNQATDVTGAQGAPVISTRSIETALIARDGQTVVLGGLSEALRERENTGIPGLVRIPVVGGFFGSRRRTTADTELFIFLTPRIIRNDEELDATVRDVRANSSRTGGLMRKSPPVVLPRPKKQAAPAPQPAAPRRNPAPAAPWDGWSAFARCCAG